MISVAKATVHRLVRSPTLLSQAGAVVGMGSALLVLPLMAALLPAAEIALWLYYSLFIMLGMMSDFGFGHTLVRGCAYFCSGAKEIPSGDSNDRIERGEGINIVGLESLLSTFFRCYRWIQVAALLLAGSIGVFCSSGVVAASESPLRATWAGVFVWLGLGVSLRAGIWSSYLQGLGEVAECKRIELIVGLARIAGYTGALLAGQGVLGMAAAGLAMGCWQFLWMRHSALNMHRKIGACWPVRAGFDSALFARIWPATWRQGSIGMGGYLITQAGGVASSGIGDAGLMASYLFTLRVLGIVRGLALAPVQSAVPRFIAYRSKGDWAGLRREFTRRIILCLGIAAALSFAIWLGVGYFVEHAGKELRLLSGPMFLVAAISGLLEVNHCGYSILYITKNRVPFLAASLVSGVSIAVLSLLVVGPWSVWGLLLVQASVQLAFNNWFPVYLVLRDFQNASQQGATKATRCDSPA